MTHCIKTLQLSDQSTKQFDFTETGDACRNFNSWLLNMHEYTYSTQHDDIIAVWKIKPRPVKKSRPKMWYWFEVLFYFAVIAAAIIYVSNIN